jgi:hypothetical protein
MFNVLDIQAVLGDVLRVSARLNVPKDAMPQHRARPYCVKIQYPGSKVKRPPALLRLQPAVAPFCSNPV